MTLWTSISDVIVHQRSFKQLWCIVYWSDNDFNKSLMRYILVITFEIYWTNVVSLSFFVVANIMYVENDSRASPLASRRFTIATSHLSPFFTLSVRICIFIFITNGHHGTFVLCLIDDSCLFRSWQKFLLVNFPLSLSF